MEDVPIDDPVEQAPQARSPVTLRVYDLSEGLVQRFPAVFPSVLAEHKIVPHTGVWVYEREYVYAGGIQSLSDGWKVPAPLAPRSTEANPLPSVQLTGTSGAPNPPRDPAGRDPGRRGGV